MDIPNAKGRQVLHDPYLNKGLAFSKEERQALELEGLLEHKVETLSAQLQRLNAQYARLQNDLDRNTFLMRVFDQNQVLFFAFVKQDIKAYMPIVYTPVVGEAVKNFSRQLLDNHGLIVSLEDQDVLEEVFARQARERQIDLIIVTDGEAVLGIGDWGVGGLDIAIGKLAVYTLCGGVDPARILPVALDVGTNNPVLLDSEFYVGIQSKRAVGVVYDAFIAKFVGAVRKSFPKVYLHWEDFGKHNARRILETYTPLMCTFNDDLQGTALVTVANMIAASKAIGTPLNAHRVVLLGAGTAGVGICDRIVTTLMQEGLSEAQAREVIWLVDRQGLLSEGDSTLLLFQKPYARSEAEVAEMREKLGLHTQLSLLDVVKVVKPTVLIGTSTVKGAFSEEVVKTMALHVERPIIFPLSNPTSLSEAEPYDLVHWTFGKALVATGSPFEDVVYTGKTFQIAQSNNAFAFPGLGLGIMVSKATRVTDGMLHQVCLALAESSPVHQHSEAPLLDDISNTPAISKMIALRVAEQARKEGVCGVEADVDLAKAVEEAFWQPHYPVYTKGNA